MLLLLLQVLVLVLVVLQLVVPVLALAILLSFPRTAIALPTRVAGHALKAGPGPIAQ